MIAGRVIMLSHDQGLASIAGQFVGHGQPLTRFSSPADVPDWMRPPTCVVVLDFPKPARVILYQQLRRRYLGPVLALLDPDEDSSGLPTDHGRIGILHRPFTGEELSASLDALVGSRNGTRRPKSRSLIAPPLGADTATGALDVASVFAATPARLRAPRGAIDPAGAAAPASVAPPAIPTTAVRAVAGVPATRAPVRRVAATRRRARVWRHMSPITRRRMNTLALLLVAAAALLLGATLSDGGGCGATGCGKVASAIENGEVGIPPATPDLGAPQPASGSGRGASTRDPAGPAATDPPPEPTMVVPIASGVGDLISGTSSSSGGAPLLVATTAPGSTSGSSGGTGSGGSAGGGVPSSTTQPTATTSPVTTAPATTAPATTAPPTTAPPTTDPATTAPPTTDPATTSPPTTDPATTSPSTTEPPPTGPATTTAATEPAPTTAA